MGLQVKMNWIEYMPQLTKWICFLMAQDITELHRLIIIHRETVTIAIGPLVVVRVFSETKTKTALFPHFS